MKRHLAPLLVFSLAFSPLPVLAAPAPGTPEAIVTAAYAALEKDKEGPPLPMSARLRALFALEKREVPDGDLGRIDFDWMTNGQDARITTVKVFVRDVDFAPNRRIVVVQYKNFDKQSENHFFWEKVAKGKWVLDDVRSVEKDGPGFTLSLVLKYGWDGPEEDAAAAAD